MGEQNYIHSQRNTCGFVLILQQFYPLVIQRTFFLFYIPDPLKILFKVPPVMLLAEFSVGAVIRVPRRDLTLAASYRSFSSRGRIPLSSLAPRGGSGLWGGCRLAAGCLWPRHAPYRYEMFCLRCHVPPKEIKAFCWRSVEFELSPEGSAVAMLVLLGSNGKSEGFLAQGHSDIAMVIGRQAPESQSCGGTPRPFLLLVCNFSKYSPSRTPS